jgi:hypothetical protein
VEAYGGPDRFSAGNSGGGTLVQDAQSFTFNGRTYPAVRHIVAGVPTNFTGTNAWTGIQYKLEAANVYDLHDGPIAISFPFSAFVTGTYSVSLRTTQGTIYSYVTTFSAIGGTPKMVTVLIPQMPSAASIDRSTNVGMVLQIGAINTGTYQCPTGSLNAWQAAMYVSAQGHTNWATTVNNNIMVSELQLEAGSVATPFDRRQYGQELALCQRYYEAGEFDYVWSAYTSAANARWLHHFKTTKRVSPTCTLATTYTNFSNNPFVQGQSVEGIYLQSASTAVSGAVEVKGTYTASAEL